MARELSIEWHGRVAYRDALQLQRERVEARRSGRSGDVLLLLEHPPVLTRGRRAQERHLIVGPQELAARGIEVHDVARGGGYTYHGPGQLVGYPIVDLAARGEPDVIAFLRRIEAALIGTLRELGIPAQARRGYTGVFVAARSDSRGARPRKIASIGIGVRGWITNHGFALNVARDLSGFDLIVPCGLSEVEMTSIERELGAPAPAASAVRRCVARSFSRHFSVEPTREVA